MSERAARVLLLLPWGSVPLVLAAHGLVWERLPERVAVHFSWDGTPNGWMTRGQSLGFDVAVLLFVLLTYNWKIHGRGPKESPGLLATFNLAVLLLTLIFLGLLKYNVTGSLF